MSFPYSIYDTIHIDKLNGGVRYGNTTTTDYTYTLYVNSNNSLGFEVGVNAKNDYTNAPGYGYLWTYDNIHGVQFGTDDTERMRIEPNGDITFGDYFSIPNPNNISFILQNRLQADDAAGAESFGNAVAISADGNTLAIGSILDTNSGGVFAGSVFIFTRTDSIWTQQARLQASDAAFNDWFGFSVAISADGNTVAIGSVQDDNSGGTDAGSAYIFTRSGSSWSQQARLQASDATASNAFGWAITISSDGNTVAVGAIASTSSFLPAAGSVYVFTRSGSVWTQQARLQAGDPGINDQFGYSVALSPDSNTLAIGSWLDDNSGGTDAGSVYIFTRSGSVWTQQARLQASDALTRNQFGFSVGLSIDGNILAVGANRHYNEGEIDSGSVYIFRRTGSFWTEEIRLKPSDAAEEDYFGRSISISSDGNTLAVGAIWDDNSGGIDAGAAYVFVYENSTWTQVSKLVATDPNSEDWLGFSIALSADALTLAVGANRHDNTGGIDAGSVFVFTNKFMGVIGIGTTDPLSKLHIYYNDIRKADLLRVDSYSLTTPFVVNSEGNVGIGTTYPSSKLVVTGGNQGVFKITNTTNNANDSWWIGFCHSTTSTDGNDRARIGVNIKSGGQGRLFFTTGSTSTQIERMRIDENGNVGIGTALPIVSLHVGKTDSILLPKGTTAQRPGGVTGLIRYNTDLATFEGFGAGNAWGSLGGVKSTDQLTYITAENTSNIRFFTGGIQHMILNSNGNLGIGTTSPLEKFHLTGNMMIQGDILPSACNVYSIGSSNFRFKDIYLSGNTIDLGGTLISRDSLNGRISIRSSTGNPNDKLDITAKNAYIDTSVGIGTAFPTNALHVQGSIYASGSLIASNLVLFGDTLVIDTVTSNANQVIIDNQGNGPALKVSQGGNNSVAEFYDKESGIALYIENNGLIGIGTILPIEALHVNGSILSTSGYKINSTIAISNTLAHYVDSIRGIRNVTGDYGTIQVFGDGLNNWEGYSIDGRYVFMSSDNNNCGLYNDIDNQWILYFNRTTNTNGTLTLYYAGSEKLVTSSTGITINGSIVCGTATNKATLTYVTDTARTYTIPDAGANANFVMTEGTQTINGAKTFGTVPTLPSQTLGTVFAAPAGSAGSPSFRAIAASDLPTVNIGTTQVQLSRASGNLALTGITSIDGTSTGLTGTPNITVGTINSTTINTGANNITTNNLIFGTQANKATLTYTTNTARTYTIPDAGANANFVMTEGNQSINGTKTFGTVPTLPSQSLGNFFAAPAASAGSPSFRSIASSDLPSVFIGTTTVPLSRASGNLALTGITSIDGTSTGLTGSPSITVTNVTLPQNPVGTTYGNGINATPSSMISQTFGNDDGWRIYGESASTNTGRLIIETVDDYDANESIVFRQKKTYTDFLARDLMTISGGTGNVTILGSVTASSFSGAVSGTATQVSNSLIRGSYLTGDNFNGSASTTWAVDATTAATASKVVARDSDRDIFCRLVRSDYTNQSTISGAIAYRVSTTDNYIRFCSDAAAIRTFLDVPTRGGVNATGNWGINISGNAGTVTNGVYTTGDQDIGGTKKFTGRVNIQPASSGGGQNIFNGVEAITTANGRAQLILSSAYSDIVIASSQTNANGHGSTLSFVTYNPSNAADYRKMVIGQGNWGAGEDKLYFGYGSTIPNPHSAYSASSSILTIDGTNRRVGIDAPTPSEKLHVVGNCLLNGTVSTNNNSINAGSGTVTAATFSGTATNATNVNAVADTATTTAEFITFVSSATGNTPINTNSGQLTFIPSSGSVGIGTTFARQKLDVVGTVSATAFSGPLTGTVTGTATGLAGSPNITVGTIGSGAITCTSITTNNNTITVGSGTVTAGTYQISGTTVIDSSRNLTNIGSVGSGAINCTSITTNNNTITVGSGTVTAGTYQISGTTVIDSSRNLTNIGTIGSGVITTTGLNVGTNTVINSSGNINFSGTATTTNQNRGIYWSAYDKEGTTDFSDTAYIRHTVNVGGLAGSVLELSSLNDGDDGINMVTGNNTGVRHNGNVVLNAANYNSYSPTLTGGGASGTWGINITGQSRLLKIFDVRSEIAGTQGDSYMPLPNDSFWDNNVRSVFATNQGNNSSWCGVLTVKGWNSGSYAVWQLSGSATTSRNDELYFRDGIGTTWGSWHRILHSGNINSITVANATNATTAGGLAVHTGRNNEANKIVRTDGNGYILAGWINTTSGDNGNTVPSRFYSSHDEYIRYHTRNTYKMHLGLTGKYDVGRVQFTTDTNYWTGAMGWGTEDWNTVGTWGSGFVDSWSSPGNRPGDSTHHVGIQAFHYTAGANNAYGWQMVGGPTDTWSIRRAWNTWGSWYTLLHSGNYNSYSPTLGGTGATGNWNINVTGSSGSCTGTSALASGLTGTPNITVGTVNASGNITNGGFDFILGTTDQSSRGNSGSSRALVKLSTAVLSINYNNDFSGGTLVDSILYLSRNATYYRQNSTATWGGNTGTGWGKIEYHSNRWYIVAGSDSTECLVVRRSGSDVFKIDNSGVVTNGSVPVGRITGTLPVANGGTGTTSSTGSGSVVLSASPTLTGTLTTSAITASNKVTISTPNGYDGETFELRASAEPTNYRFYMNSVVTSGVVRWVFNQVNAGTSYTNILTIDRGKIGINQNTPSYSLHVVGDIYATSDITALSDKTHKKNIRVIENALSKIHKIYGYTFQFKHDPTDKYHAGLLAQEVQEVLPEVITKNESDNSLGLAYGNVISLVVNAVKELDDKVEPKQQTHVESYIGKAVYISNIESAQDTPTVACTNKPADKRFYGIVVDKMEKENTTVCKLHTAEQVILKTKGFIWIWVTNINGSIIEQGDYITSSYLEGYATAQGTISATNSTIGKVLKDIDFTDPFLEDHYKVRYLTESGIEISSEEFKFDRCHIAVFVLCCV